MPTPMKAPGMRQRRNREVTRATLPSVEVAARNRVPTLYKRGPAQKWHPRVVAWWKAIWRSPMASEWLDADVVGVVYRTAELQQDFWTATDSGGRVAVEARIVKNEERLGLSPIDRRRLQWEIEKGDEAAEKTQRRQRVRQLDHAAGKDPRDVLKVAS